MGIDKTGVDSAIKMESGAFALDGTDSAGGVRWEALSRLIHERRSNLRIVPDRPVPRELIERLCDAACWAPNHKLTHPWRFAIVTGEGRRRLGEVAAEGLVRMGQTAPALLEKTRQKYLRAPVFIIAGSAAHPQPHLHRENRDAVAAGIQNLLLAATALGLASYWSSGIVVEVPEVKTFAGLNPEDEIVALIYLGWPAESAPPGRRSPPAITVVDA